MKISEKAYKAARRRHAWALQWNMNYERMQATGFAYAMVPVMKELYSTKEEQCQNLERHLMFYNSHACGSAVICGASVALEESGNIDVVNEFKAAMMGPFAGIGDTIQYALFSSLFSLIGAGLASEGSWLALPVIVLPMFAFFVLRWPLFDLGYKQSTAVLEDISGKISIQKIERLATIVGLTVIGGFIPNVMSGVTLKYKYVKEIIDTATNEPVTQEFVLQDILDSLLPYMLPIAFVSLAYWLMKVKKVSPVKTIIILALIGFTLGAIGIL